MATVAGVIRYHVAGLPTSAVLSEVEITATAQQVSFGRVEGGNTADLGPTGQLLHQWWSSALVEPSFAADFAVTSTEASVVKDLLASDITCTRAAALVASVRALAERAQIRLPSLEHTAVVGMIESGGELSCPSSVKTREITQALAGVGIQRLIGPFSTADPALQGLEIKPAHNLDGLLRLTLGDDPVAVMRLILEWLVLFDPDIQGPEAEVWREAERRAAENLSVLHEWFAEITRRPPRSQVIRQGTLAALASLANSQSGHDTQAPERTVAALQKAGYQLTAVWLLTRWAFLLREQQYPVEADRCLQNAEQLQQALPLAQPTPVLLHQLGRALYSKARFAHALEKYWQGWSFLHQSAGNNDQRADFYNSAGKCFNDVYQFAMALELFERARRIRVTLRQNDKQARTSGAMGEAYWRVGDVDNAERCCRKNVELSQQVGRARNDRHDEMRATNFLAHILFAKGDFDGAEPLYRQTEKYYGERYDRGEQNEASNLVYSIEGLARVAAARRQWNGVQQFVVDTFEAARGTLKPTNAAVLPVALLAYLDALRLRRTGDHEAATIRLQEAETLLQALYPAERAMVLIEQVIGALHAGWPRTDSTPLLNKAADVLQSFLNIADQPQTIGAFAPIRAEVEVGRGALGTQGQQFLAQDKQRRTKLEEYFATARGHLAAGNQPDAIHALRAIQESVVFFRDILKHIEV